MLRRDFMKNAFVSAVALSAAGSVLATTPMFAARNYPRQTRSSGATTTKVKLGIDVLEEENFARLRGDSVGLVTNQAGVNSRGESTISILHTRGRRAGVRLAKLFGPEHGIYGDVPAEKIVQNQIDSKTGLPVFSLYGATRKPAPEMLSGLTRMVIDLQDVGSRSYTYISCMRYVLEACFERGIPVLVLDRPNPLGGLKCDGPMLAPKWQSYVGLYPVPYVHGLTIGELAIAAVRENWLTLSQQGRSRGRVDVMKMRGWTRNMRWRDTGLRWIPTSPYINSPEAVEGYAMSGLGTMTGGFGHTGRGKNGELTYPFRWITFSQKDEKDMTKLIAGFAIRGITPLPRIVNDKGGAYIAISNWDALRPCELSFHMMRAACVLNRGNPFAELAGSQRDLFIKHLGSENFFNDLAEKGARTDIVAWCNLWQKQAEAFSRRVAAHRLYK